MKTEVYTKDGELLFTITKNEDKWQLNPKSSKTRVRFEFDIKKRALYDDTGMVRILSEILSKKTLEVSHNLEAILNEIDEYSLSIDERYTLNKLNTLTY